MRLTTGCQMTVAKVLGRKEVCAAPEPSRSCLGERTEGIPPGRQRPMTWQTFVQAHWPALVAADFFTTEVWTVRGLVTYYTVFVLELQSRRVQVIGRMPYPDEAFVIQSLRHASSETDGLLRAGCLLLCDRDPKWSRGVEELLRTAGVRVVRTPASAPNCNAYAERFGQ